MRKISVRKNSGGNIFGGKNFGDFLPDFGVIFGESPKNFGGTKFGEKYSVEKSWQLFTQYLIEITESFDVNRTKKSITLILV